MAAAPLEAHGFGEPAFTLILEPTMAAGDNVWTLCHGRGGAYLDALRTASREELEAAQQRVREHHDADFPMDAARRLDQIGAALLDQREGRSRGA